MCCGVTIKVYWSHCIRYTGQTADTEGERETERDHFQSHTCAKETTYFVHY